MLRGLRQTHTGKELIGINFPIQLSRFLFKLLNKLSWAEPNPVGLSLAGALLNLTGKNNSIEKKTVLSGI